MSTPTLEQRIASALTADDTKAADIAALIAETEIAIAAADKAADIEREKALDPLASPDAARARAAMEDAAFARDRLRSVLPRLRERLTEVETAEYAKQWDADFRGVEARRDELALEYAELYPRLVAQLVDLLRRAEAVDEEVSSVNASARPGEPRRLFCVELAARGLEGFTRAIPSIAAELRLPAFGRGSGQPEIEWPPQRKFDPAMFAPVPFDRRYSADWGLVQEEAARAEADRAAREAAEREAKALENYHGPRWREGEGASRE